MAKCVRCKHSFPDTEIQRNWEILFTRSSFITDTIQRLIRAGKRTWPLGTDYGICAKCAHDLDAPRYQAHAITFLYDAANRPSESGGVFDYDSLRNAVLVAALDPIPEINMGAQPPLGFGRYGERFHDHLLPRADQGRRVDYQITRRQPVGYGLPPERVGSLSPIRTYKDRSAPRALQSAQAEGDVQYECIICADTGETYVKRACEGCTALICKICFYRLNPHNCPQCRRPLPKTWQDHEFRAAPIT